MADVNKLVFAILQFLESQTQNSQIGDEAVESIEVAIQCLETAFGISTSDELIAGQLTTNRSLLEIFNSATGNTQPLSANVSVNLMPEAPLVDDNGLASTAGAAAGSGDSTTEITPEAKAEAEKLKSDGNDLMKNERYRDAVECYTKAVSIDSGNAVYYSNRAAAYSKLDDHMRAIQDCEKAVSIDPSYSKAYGRMGLAYTNLNELEKAKEAYAKAVDLEPSNDSYQTNLQIAEQKLREANLGGGGMPPGGFPFPGMGGPTMGGLDVGAVLNNPGLMNMAAQFMQNPQMQQMMQSMMGQAMQPGAAPGGGGSPEGASFTNLLQVGQNLASQIQQTNPELIDQLRQMRGQQPPGNPDDPNPSNGNEQSGDGGGGQSQGGSDSSPAS